MTRSSITLLSAALLTSASAVWGGPASAQTSPETQSCGGLLCDIGVFGHKVPAKPVAVTPEAPAKPAQTAAIAPPPVVVEPPHKIVKKIAAATSSAAKAPIMKASTAPRAATSRPARAPGIGGADAGPRPSSPADMFRPIY